MTISSYFLRYVHHVITYEFVVKFINRETTVQTFNKGIKKVTKGFPIVLQKLYSTGKYDIDDLLLKF